LASVILGALVPVLHDVVPRRSGISKRSHVRAVAGDLAVAAAQFSLTFTLLAHQACLMTDAIGRALVRLLVTRRHLLEWMTAAQAKAGQDLSLAAFVRRMGGGVALAIVVAGLVLLLGAASAAARARPPGRFPLSASGCSRHWSGGGSACRRRTPARSRWVTTMPARCARRRGGPGTSSKPSSVPRTTRCLRTTSRRTRGPWWR